jgi:hypothetical protein
VPTSRSTTRTALPLLLALLPAAFLLTQLELPLMEDGLFWWVPRALLFAERGPGLVAAGDLPTACLPDTLLPPQWSGGLPDYGHPPLWFLYLALWVRLLGPQAWVIHLACVPVALALGWGAVSLARQLAGPAAWPLALLVLCSPPTLAQLLRPDTDLPLLALSICALVALAGQRLGSFALLAVLATWVKEPGVLLAIPAVGLGLLRRSPRHLLAGLVPPMALVAWALVHHQATGWATAGAEHLPDGVASYLQDLGAVLKLTLLDDGRWAVLGFAAVTGGLALWRRPPPAAPLSSRLARDAAWACGITASAQVLLFAGLNFLGGRGLQDAYTHVRYLLPAMACASLLLGALGLRWLLASAPPLRARPLRAVLAVACAPCLLALPGARALHPRGPEANLYLLDHAQAWRQAAAELEGRGAPQGIVWVESHLFTALTRPYAGLVAEPMQGLRPFGPDIGPEGIAPGDLLVHGSYGEPLSRLAELAREPESVIVAGQAWVRIERVVPGRAAGEPLPSSP